MRPPLAGARVWIQATEHGEAGSRFTLCDMRRLALSVMLAVLVVGPASVVHAQEENLRDPFEPLLSAETDTTTTTTGDGTIAPTTTDTDTDTDVEPAPTDGLPTTGGDADRWVALAYVLVAAGGAALALARTSRQTP